MPAFSNASEARLSTCDERLQRVFREVVKVVDCTVLVGHRNETDQERAFAEGKSQKHWPFGEHNAQPSRAVDVIPVVPDGLSVWNVLDPAVEVYWWKLNYAVMRIAANQGVVLRFGMDWNSDGDTKDARLRDFPHWEVV